MKLLYAYSPNARPSEQIETLAFVKDVESRGICEVVYGNTDKKDYAELLNEAFEQKETFILLEQDIVPTISQLEELINADYPIACYNYMLPSHNLVCRNYKQVSRMNGREIYGDPEYNALDNFYDFYGFGFTKFSHPVCDFNFKLIIDNLYNNPPDFLYNLIKNDKTKWHILDTLFSYYTSIKGYKAKSLGIVKHNHKTF